MGLTRCELLLLLSLLLLLFSRHDLSFLTNLGIAFIYLFLGWLFATFFVLIGHHFYIWVYE